MSHKQTNLTLKEYLHQYLVARSPKTSTQDYTKSMISEIDCQKMFNRKLMNIKKMIKNLVKDSLAQGALEKELEELKVIFKECRSCMGPGSKDINETTDLTKNSGKVFKKKNISIPVIPIADDSLEDIRITNLVSSEEKKEQDPKLNLKEKQIPTIKRLQLQNNFTEERQNESANSNLGNNSKVYKTFSKQNNTQMTPTFQNSGRNKNFELMILTDDCMPPTLDKKYSLLESIRNTKKSFTGQNNTNENKNQLNR